MSGTLISRLTSTALASAVSALVLWWLLRDGAGQALILALQGASPWPLILGALLAIVIQIARAWRFAVMTTGKLALPAWIMIGIATRLILLNFLLPFKLGELSFPVMMKRAFDTPFGQGAGILILCRLFDLGVVAAILLLSAALLFDDAVIGWSPLLLAFTGLLAVIAPILMTDLLPWLRRLTARWPRLDRLIEQIAFGATMIRPFPQRLLVSLLTGSIWLLHASIAFLTALAVDAGLDFLPMAMASAASNLAFALPINGVAGLGPPQAAWATILHLQKVDWTPAITTALLCHGLLLSTLSVWGVVTLIGTAGRQSGLAAGQKAGGGGQAPP